MSLESLHTALAAANLIDDLEMGEGFLSGQTTFAAAGVEVPVNVDPDPSEEGIEVEDALIVARAGALLGMTSEAYGRIVDEVAEELEVALAEESIEIIADVRGDLTPVALLVLPDEHGLVLAAPTQLPDGAMIVFLDDEFEITQIQLQGAGGGGCGGDCACGADEGDEIAASVDELMATLSTEK